jgi:hypothetical protein
METHPEQEAATSAPSLGDLIAAKRDQNGPKKAKKQREPKPGKQQAERKAKNSSGRAKANRFLTGLLLLPAIWIGYSATMKGFEQNGFGKRTPAANAPATSRPGGGETAAAKPAAEPQMDAQAAFLARRNAQNLASVFSSAMAAESPNFADVRDKETAVRRLREGVMGSGSFATTMFQVPRITDQQAQEAMANLRWSEGSGLVYELNEEVAKMAGPTPRTAENHRMIAVRNAQNLASVYSAGMAAGSPGLASADSVQSAVELLHRGVLGGGAFEDVTFRAPALSVEQVKSAMAHLHWDETTNSLVFAQNDAAGSSGGGQETPAENVSGRNGERQEVKLAQELELAIARAETINLAMVAFIQSNGLERAKVLWDESKNADNRYRLLVPFLAHTPDSIDEFMPQGHSLQLPESLLPLQKVPLLAGGETLEY